MIAINRVFTDLSRSLFLVILVYAPWAYGCTEAWAIDILDNCLGVVGLLWLVGIIARKECPAIHPMMLLMVLFLFSEGWWLAENAHFRFAAATNTFVPILPRFGKLPGGVDEVTSAAMMVRISGILAALLFTADLAANALWRLRLIGIMGATGLSVILLGLVQRVTNAPMIFWEENRQGSQFFATYFYHANAASFINLALPASAGMLWRSMRRPRAYLARAFWCAAFLISLAGAFVNVSRAGLVVTVLILVILLLWRSKYLLVTLAALPRRIAIIYVALALAVLFLVINSVGWQTAADRWGEFGGELQKRNARLLVAKTCWRILPVSGWWGFGPGTFQITFPHFTGDLGNTIAGIWRFAHEDYLQIAIEWGWFGAAVWGALLFGSIGCGYLRYWRDGEDLTGGERMALFVSATALLGMAVHATVDFPFQIASLQLYAATYTGIIWGTLRGDKGASTPAAVNSR